MSHKPTPQQQFVIEKSRTTPLLKTYGANGQVLWSFADGSDVRRDIAENCVLIGLVEPLNDGLFGDSQSYGAS